MTVFPILVRRLVVLAAVASPAFAPAGAVGQQPQARITGLVRDVTDADPLALVSVGFNGRIVSVTGANGRFQIVNVGYGTNLLELRRIGYAPLSMEVWIAADERDLQLAIDMERAPMALAPIEVDADAVPENRKLQGFVERRRMGFGRFVDRAEIEQIAPAVPTDVLRRVPGVLIRPNPNYGSGDPRRYIVETNRTMSRLSGGGCPLLLFLDGAYVGSTGDFDIDVMFSIHQIDAVEVYTGPAQIPARFNRINSDCGVIAFWTR